MIIKRWFSLNEFEKSRSNKVAAEIFLVGKKTCIFGNQDLFLNKLYVVSKAWEDLGDCDVAFLFSFRLLVF